MAENPVVVMRRLRWWQLAWFTLWPPARRAWEASLRAGIHWLVEHPEIPVLIEED